MDSIFKFMSTKTCLDRMLELKRETHSEHQWQQAVKLEFCQSSIISNWGNKRTYIVTDVVFDESPVSKTFDHRGKEVSIAQYFADTYQMHVSKPNQPLFMIKIAECYHYLPPEFCLIDGVPDSVRKGPGMRDALAKTRIRPHEKLRKIQEMVNELFQQKAVKDWDLTIENKPIEMGTSVLATPKLLQGNQLIHCDE